MNTQWRSWLLLLLCIQETTELYAAEPLEGGAMVDVGDLLGVAAFAGALRERGVSVGRHAVWRWVREGKVDAVRIGGRWFVRASEVRRLVAVGLEGGTGAMGNGQGSVDSFTKEIHDGGTEREVCYRVPVALWEKVQTELEALKAKEEAGKDLTTGDTGSTGEEQPDGLYGPSREPGKFHRYTAVELFMKEQYSDALQVIHETAVERDAAIAARDALAAELQKEHVFEQARNSTHVCSLNMMPRKLKEALDSLDYRHDAIKRLMEEKEVLENTLNNFLRTHQEAEAKRVAAEQEESRRAAEAQRKEAGKGRDRVDVSLRLVQAMTSGSVESAISEGDDFRTALGLVLKGVEHEVESARMKHARFNSAHEGYAVILEELDELKAEVWKKRELRDKAKMQEEAVQVAAMAVRFVLDVI